MLTRMRNAITGYGVSNSIVINVVAGVVLAGAVAVIYGVPVSVVVAVVAGVVFLIA